MGSDLCGACRRGDHYACRLFRCDCPQDGCVRGRQAGVVRKGVREVPTPSPKQPKPVPRTVVEKPPKEPPKPVVEQDVTRRSPVARERVARPNQEFLNADFDLPSQPSACSKGHDRSRQHLWDIEPPRWYCCICGRVYAADRTGLLVKDS